MPLRDPRAPLSRDPTPAVIARWEKKIADRVARYERRLVERLTRLLSGTPRWRCDICGASTSGTRTGRCRGACEG